MNAEPTPPRLVYLDNAATSWPKPPCVAEAMRRFLDETGANPGRSGHRLSIAASRVVYSAREALAELFNAPDPLRVTFGLNITDALNQALHGLLRPGQHVITSGMEHNSVMRPLRALEARGVLVTVIPCATDGTLNPADVEAAIRPETRMLAINHASNVCGTIQPLRPLGEIARRHNLLLLVDTAQSAGAFPIDMQADLIDLLAFTGHKSLYGPTGTGGLILGARVDEGQLVPLRQGGTGSHSEHEQQPSFLPDLLESGTPNAVGLAGLEASVRWILQKGVAAIRDEEQALVGTLLAGLQETPRVKIHGRGTGEGQTATIALNIEGMAPSEAGLRLDEEFGILCRVGLHCAPAAHRTLGTFPDGTLRFGLGIFNTPQDVTRALTAVRTLAGGR
jgi:cysteine desulfurase / selenocysteine lyase